MRVCVVPCPLQHDFPVVSSHVAGGGAHAYGRRRRAASGTRTHEPSGVRFLARTRARAHTQTRRRLSTAGAMLGSCLPCPVPPFPWVLTGGSCPRCSLPGRRQRRGRRLCGGAAQGGRCPGPGGAVGERWVQQAGGGGNQRLGRHHAGACATGGPLCPQLRGLSSQAGRGHGPCGMVWWGACVLRCPVCCGERVASTECVPW
jgi:hypothetical protein